MFDVSICIITKNECDNLNECLQRITKYNDNEFFEIVVVDTGSTDDSKRIATRYTDNIYDFVWCDDFSAARNFAISKASAEYIFMLDTDEFIDEINLAELRTLINDNPNAVGRMHRKNLYQSAGNNMTSNELVNRLFPKSLYHYEARIHEQITPLNKANDGDVYETYVIPIFTTHVGYQGDGDVKKQKAMRNLRLLLEELKDTPDDPYILYQIGKAYFYDQQYNEAIPYFEKAMEQPLDMSLEYVHSIVTTFGYCLIYTEQFANALMLEGVYSDFQNDADYLFVMGLIYMYNARFNDAIESFLKATLIPVCTVEGVNSYLAFYNVGVILECLGDKTNAATYYRKCGDYSDAIEGLRRLSL